MSGPNRATHSDAAAAERLLLAWEYRVNGWTEQMSADEMGVDRSTISRWLKKAWEGRVEPAAAQLREVELEKLDRLERLALAVVDRPHLLVSAGRVVMLLNETSGKEEPILDDGPILAAIDRLVRISVARAEIAGFKAPVKIQGEMRLPGLDPQLRKELEEAQALAEEQRRQILGEEPAS
jgi:transposase-like protein